uniref:Uncharacterized protein n=1 Tax=Anguilla anguilla TaxID=7936 RepID=A0A0E9UF38_ANGAN
MFSYAAGGSITHYTTGGTNNALCSFESCDLSLPAHTPSPTQRSMTLTCS